MKNLNMDYFFSLNKSKENSSNNIKVFTNKIFNNPLQKNIKEIPNDINAFNPLKRTHRPLSTAYCINLKDFNKQRINEFLKQKIYRNENIVQKNNIYSENLNSIIDVFNSNNVYKLVNFHQKVNGNGLEDLVLKNIVPLPTIKEKNNFFIGKHPLSFNQSQENKNVIQKNRSTNYPGFFIEKENKTFVNYKNSVNNNNPAKLNNQNSKIFMYILNKNINSLAKNDISHKNNSLIKNDNRRYNNTSHSFLYNSITNNMESNCNNSLIYSYQQQSNSSLNNKNTINCPKSNDNIIFRINNENNNSNFLVKVDNTDKIKNVRTLCKEREIKRQNLKCFYYLILPGNASYLVEQCMNHRINWMKPFSIVTSLYNFKWQELSYGIDYESLGHFQNVKQIVNHYENHFVISNKAKMFANFLNYCEKKKISAFKYVPFTIVFHLKDEKPLKPEKDKNYENNNDSLNKKNNNKYEKLKDFMNNINKYIVKYDEIGKYYEKESFKKYVKYLKYKEMAKENDHLNIKDYKKITLKKKYKVSRKNNKRKHLSFNINQKKELSPDNDDIDDDYNNNNNLNYTFYTDIFNNLVEDNNIPIYDKNKERKEEESAKNQKSEEHIIGSNTLIEIPESHFTGKNIWVVKAINLNRGMCIRIVNSYEQMLKVINKFKEGVDYNFTKAKLEENENILQIKNTIIKNKNINASPYKNYKNINEDEKIIKKNITANILNFTNKDRNSNSKINISIEKYKKQKTDEKKKNNEEKLYNCNKIIIQKYIENPLLYRGRKCDMRIWVLLTQTMKVYVFKEGHLKTCSIEYNINSKDAFVHITNYSFQKYNNNFGKYEKGNEVPFYEFQKFLNENYSEKKYNIKVDLMNQIKEIVKLTMRSVRDKINRNNRNYQFEIFGYDFMMDKDFNLFLIEINTNPGLEESSPWIKLIVPRMLDDALRLTIDQLFDTKYDFNVISKNKNEQEINNYKQILKNYKKNIDINGVNVSSYSNKKSEINSINMDISQDGIKNKNNQYCLKTIPTLDEKNCDDEKEADVSSDKNKKHKDNEKNDKNNNLTKDKDNINNNKRYLSPFPIPGYSLYENIWDYICDLHDNDPQEIIIGKEEEDTSNINNKKRKNFTNKKKKNKKNKMKNN